MTRNEFDSVFVNNYEWLKACAMTCEGNMSAAEDLVQDTYVKAVNHGVEELASIESAKKWLYTTMKNLYIDKCRHEACLDMSGAVEDMDKEYEDNWLDEQFTSRLINLDAAMASIRDDYRKALLLFAEGYSYKEIADEMATDVKNVTNYVYRGKQAIREYYAA